MPVDLRPCPCLSLMVTFPCERCLPRWCLCFEREECMLTTVFVESRSASSADVLPGPISVTYTMKVTTLLLACSPH